MASNAHNPHGRRLYLPLTPVSTPGSTPTSELGARGRTSAAVGRKPEWLKTRASVGPNFAELKRLMRDGDLHTVCEEASCPNIYECWEDREATFLVLGDLCTRRCGFCDVQTGKPLPVDPTEPVRVAEAVRRMGLRYVVLTGVARDDLPDGGAQAWADCIRAVRAVLPTCHIEVLPTDFRGLEADITTVIAAEPDVFAHNLETVPRLHPKIRPAFTYDRTLEALRLAKAARAGQVTKSNLILGMGEHPDEIKEAMRDLRSVHVDLLTIGQYLQPTAHHLPVDRWVDPSEFAQLADAGRAMGFAHVESGPLVRSSYRAGRQFRAAMAAMAAMEQDENEGAGL